MAKLVVLNGRLRIDETSSHTLVKVADGSNCCCLAKLIYIYYDWRAGGADLDTKTTFLGDSVGWFCPGMNNFPFVGYSKGYLTWGGDVVGANGYETVIADVGKAYADGMWSGNTTIDLGAGWYSYGSSIVIRVRSTPWSVFSPTVDPTEQTLTLTVPYSPESCVKPTVATVTVHADGTFELSPV